MDAQGRGRAAYWAGLATLSLLLLVTVWSARYLPASDGPEGVFAAHVLNHYDDPASGVLRAQLIPTWQFAARGFTFVFGPLEGLLGWRDGLRVALSVILLGTAWAYVALVHAVEPERRALAFVGFPLALTWSFYMGFFAFSIGTALGLVTLAVVMRTEPKATGRWALVALLLFVQAVSHVFSAVVTGVLVACVTLLRGPRTELTSRAARLALVGLPAISILVAAGATRAPGQVSIARTVLFRPLRETLLLFPRFLSPGPEARALLVTATVVACVAIVIARARRMRRLDRVIAALAVSLLVLGIFGPRDIPGWQLMSPRFIPTGASLIFAVVPLEAVRALIRNAITMALFACAVAALTVSINFHKALAASCADVVDALEAPITRRALQLPISLEPTCGVSSDPLKSEVPYMSSLHHIGALFAVAEGGSTPYLFAGSASAHAFLIRPNGMPVPPVPDAEHYWAIFASPEFGAQDVYRRRVLDELAVFGMFYEGVVVTGARTTDFEAWDTRGFLRDWARGSVLVAHFSPCALDITMPGDALTSSVSGPVFDVGAGLRTMLAGVSVAGEPGGGFLHFVVPYAPCGRVWVHPRWDAPTRACSNAAPSGKVYATVSHTDAVIACGSLVERAPVPGN